MSRQVNGSYVCGSSWWTDGAVPFFLDAVTNLGPLLVVLAPVEGRELGRSWVGGRTALREASVEVLPCLHLERFDLSIRASTDNLFPFSILLLLLLYVLLADAAATDGRAPARSCRRLLCPDLRPVRTLVQGEVADVRPGEVVDVAVCRGRGMDGGGKRGSRWRGRTCGGDRRRAVAVRGGDGVAGDEFVVRVGVEGRGSNRCARERRERARRDKGLNDAVGLFGTDASVEIRSSHARRRGRTRTRQTSRVRARTHHVLTLLLRLLRQRRLALRRHVLAPLAVIQRRGFEGRATEFEADPRLVIAVLEDVGAVFRKGERDPDVAGGGGSERALLRLVEADRSGGGTRNEGRRKGELHGAGRDGDSGSGQRRRRRLGVEVDKGFVGSFASREREFVDGCMAGNFGMLTEQRAIRPKGTCVRAVELLPGAAAA
ncbi:hypothetical protein RTBOTA2_005378 [Rhodotorula toruloides]|nr:hypothetical protein RTBOTA2_005378 [Rhodotorula toruloides]